MSKGKSEKYLLMESLANSLKDERNQMFKEVIRLRDEVKDLKESRKYVYIVMSTDGHVISAHTGYETAVEAVEKQRDLVNQLIEMKDSKDVAYDEKVKYFYLSVLPLENE